ncbi:MAG TPA: hypothetical protein VF165_17330 [Nocardioidaceae bacterium]
MSGVRRPGRTQKIAYDETPLSARTPDVDARVGWVLAMSRLHHPDPAMGDGRLFVEALKEAGCYASRSLVSRWESGEIPVSYDGLAGYERALGLETGRLSSLVGYLRAAVPGVKPRIVRPQLDTGSGLFSARLDELIELAEDGEANAGDWQELGWHLGAAPLVHLRARTWEAISHRLVNELPRAVRVPYRQYSTAALNIASVRRAQEFLTDAVTDYVNTPGVQVLTTSIGLLYHLPTRKAAKMVLDLIDSRSPGSVYAIAVWVAAQKLARGDFTAEERTRLDMMLLKMWRANPVKAAEQLAELIASLPEGLRSTLTDAATKAGSRKLGYVVETGEDFAPEVAARVSGDLAMAARKRVPETAAYDDDRMLVRLVREALFHRDSERRHLAALVISASPFAEAVADELLALLAAPGTQEPVRMRAATLAGYLTSDTHRLRTLRFLEDRSEYVARVLTQAVGRMTFTDFSDQVVRASLREEWSPRERAKMYALGMSGSPAIETIAQSTQAADWQRTAAQWWLSQGPAIRE